MFEVELFHSTVVLRVLVTWIVDWLSICKLDGALFLQSISDNKFHIQQISFPASTAAEYSASVDDSATIPCNLEDQLTAPVPIRERFVGCVVRAVGDHVVCCS